MFHACQQPAGLQGIIIEGGHPGLTDDKERVARLEADEQWCQRLRHQPLSEVFDAWYRQPVFAALTETERAALVALRSHNDGNALAQMLAATSLGRQPDLRAALRDAAFPVHYFFGEHDRKFRALASEAARHCYAIPAAGHNAHRENPAAVAALLARILPLEIKDRP
jgi:2-succinyl-6-hydroxy-2,4-cyclohexadiene-1-carboxylate synthase